MITFKPIITEKTLLDQEKNHKYHFLVEKDATKTQIHSAFTQVFGAVPVRVNTIIVKAQVKMDWKRRTPKKIGDKKKAVITVAKDAKINLFSKDSSKKK